MTGSFGLVVLTSVTSLTLPVNAAVIGTLSSTIVYIALSLILPSEQNQLVEVLHDKASAALEED